MKTTTLFLKMSRVVPFARDHVDSRNVSAYIIAYEPLKLILYQI